MKLNIDEKKLEKEIIKKVAEMVVAGKYNIFFGTKWDVDEIAKKITFESPEIRKMTEEKVRECLNDPEFMSHALEKILIDNFKNVEIDD